MMIYEQGFYCSDALPTPEKLDLLVCLMKNLCIESTIV